MKNAVTLVVMCCLLVMAACACADVPRAVWFADLQPRNASNEVDWTMWYQPGIGQYLRYAAFKTPSACIGPPSGGEVWAPLNSYSIPYYVTLGDRDPVNNKGWLILGFSEPIVDNPKNCYGLDFIVFSNACFKAALPPKAPPIPDPTDRWQEPAFVEISQDLNTWYLIRPNILPAELIPSPLANADTGNSRTMLRGYAEYTPTTHLPAAGDFDPFSNVTRTAEELYTIPDRPSVPAGFNTVRFDYVSGGGDAMDIADAVMEAAPGVPALDELGREIKANINSFKYVRMTDAVAGDYATGLGEISAEIDAVSAVRPALSIGEARALDEGGFALVTEAIVTAVLPDSFFIEAPNRSAAIKVMYATSTAADGKLVAVGDKMTVSGHLTKVGGKFKLPDPMWTCTSIGNAMPASLGISMANLGNTMAYGLRVRTCGKVTSRGTGYCVIKDGSNTAKITWSGSYSAPAINTYLSVTGICDREEATGAVTIIAVSPITDLRIF